MAKKIEIIENYLIVTDSVTGVTDEFPKGWCRYVEWGETSQVLIKSIGDASFDKVYSFSDLVDDTDTPFVNYAALLAFLRENTGKPSPEAAGSYINPADYTGTDTEKIQAAMDAAANTITPVLIFQKDGSNTPWDIEEAILLASNTTVIIDGAILKLTDTSRDNIFRTENCGLGLTAPYTVLENIHIIGQNSAQLEGADVPRATGDAGKALHTTTDSGFTLSFGTDYGVGGQTQTGDWRNYTILLTYTNNFSITGISFIDPHAYCISLERCTFGIIRDLLIDAPKIRTITGYGTQYINNTNLLDIRLGCNNIICSSLRGFSDDDPIAMILADLGDTGGIFGEYQVTGNAYGGESDDIYNISLKDMFLSTNAHHVRLLLKEPVSTEKIYNIDIKNLTDTGDGNAGLALIRIGDDHPLYGDANPFGTIFNINIDNIKNTETDYVILVEGSFSESNISNIIDNSSENASYPIHFQANHIGCRNVQLNNIWKLNVANDLAANLEGATPDLISLKIIPIIVALSDTTTALSTGIGVESFRMPYAFRLTEVRGSVGTAGTTTSIIVDINLAGTGTIMTTNKIEIEATEKTSKDATTQPTLTTTDLADDDELTFDIDSVDSGGTGLALKATLIGYRI